MDYPLSSPARSGSLVSFLRRRLVSLAFAALFVTLSAIAAYVVLEYGRPEGWADTKPSVSITPSPPQPVVFKETVGWFRQNQTIMEALNQQGLSSELALQIIDSARPVYDLARVKAGYPYYLYFAPEGRFRDFRYPVDDERYLTVYHDVARNCLVPVVKRFPFETRVVPVSAEIEDSLFSTLQGVGEEDQLALDLADIFSSDIDFYTDIQKGDSFRVLVQKKYLDGRFAKYGAVLAATFTNQQKLITGLLFEDQNGKPAYYTPEGKALRRSFLKSPLKFASARVTSRFSMARRHPILKIVRPHLGVDYAAPAGTPVQAVGAGIVRSAGRNGNSGKMVRIRHSNGYETLYLHLSRINVKAGARVEQGELIGWVGSTGLSTGPHLDFRVLRNGKAINPAKVVFPPAAPVAPDKFDQFTALRDDLMAQLTTD
jgi:murein DD-endopeptidase MepM/ murein hydrolase activator NlpD